MYGFTITPDSNTFTKRPYLTEKDRRSISQLVEEITRAKCNAEVAEIAKKIVKIDERNQTINKHEKLIHIAQDLVSSLDNGKYFTVSGLAHAIFHEPAGCGCFSVNRYGKDAVPYGAAKVAAERMVATGVLEIRKIRHCGATIEAYYKK